jgi:hypothetical protein
MEDWARRHVSDNCCFHHRRTLLLRLLHLAGYPSAYYRPSSFHVGCSTHPLEQTEGGSLEHLTQTATTTTPREETSGKKNDIGIELKDLIDIWRREFWFSKKLILVFPGHESLWVHRRFLFYFWFVEIRPHTPSHLLGGEQQQGGLNPDQLLEAVEKCEEGFSPNEAGGLVADADLEWPMVESELWLAQYCIQHDEVERYQAQAAFAAAYKLWVLEVFSKCSKPQERIHNTALQGTLQDLCNLRPRHSVLWKAKATQLEHASC